MASNQVVLSHRHHVSSKVMLMLILLFIADPSNAQRSRRSCFLKTRPVNEPAQCDFNSRYRTMSGRCNNLVNPEWGSAGSVLRRLVPAAYQDGSSVPRGGRHPSSLPSPRWISQKNHPDSDIPDSRFTHMVMQFGQFLDHDITLTPKDEETDCCQSGVQHPECFTIPIPSQDRFFSWVNSTAHCLNFVRSQPACQERIREQFNSVTSYIDASNVYGSDSDHSAILRTFSDGLMQLNSNTEQLPTREQLNSRPNPSLLRPERSEDFMAGDMRVNEHPFLATSHLLFMREHNRIAKLLKEYLPPSLHQDEILYQETRRLLAAEMQNIVYGEFLPTVLGIEYMTRYNLIVKEESDYDPSVDATVINAFSTAAFRFGHSMINGMFKLVSQRGERSSDGRSNDVYWLWRLREVFDGQSIRGARLPMENMIEGLISQEPQTVDPYFSTEITDHLFQKNEQRHNFGEDLIALNLQRGRDHGLPGYNEYRKACGMKPLVSWNDHPSDHLQDYWKKLKDVYERVDDIDLFVGAIGEVPVRGGIIGPTFACIISEQFRRIKFGDRFFYTHRNANGLSPVAKREVLKRTLADVICDVTQLQKVQKWVTLQPNHDFNPMKECSGSQRMDLRAVAEEIAQELLSNPNGLPTFNHVNNNVVRSQPVTFEGNSLLPFSNQFQPQFGAGNPQQQITPRALNPACIIGFC